jgi:hypothetical protein
MTQVVQHLPGKGLSSNPSITKIKFGFAYAMYKKFHLQKIYVQRIKIMNVRKTKQQDAFSRIVYESVKLGRD